MNFFENFDKAQKVQIGNGHVFEIPAFPDSTGASNEAKMVAAGVWLNVATELLPRITALKADKRFTDIGRAEHIDPVAQTAITRLVGGWHNLDSFERSINSIESQMCAIPQIEQSNLLAQLQDAEIRQWWDRQETKARAEMMRRFEEGGEAQRIALAVLRSPIPQVDTEKSFFKNAWERAARVANPLVAERVDLGRASIEWAQKNLQFAAAAVKTSIEWTPDRVLRHAVTVENGMFAKHAHRLGFGERDVNQMMLRTASRQ